MTVQYQLPKYFLAGIMSHMQNMVDHCHAPNDSAKAKNAVRMCKKDLQRIKRIISENNEKDIRILQ